MGSDRAMLIGKYTGFSIYIRKEAKSQANILHFLLNKAAEIEKLQSIRIIKIIKTGLEMNEMKTEKKCKNQGY